MISVIRALAVGAIGGVLAFVTGVPAPWLAGSLIATIIAVYSNQNLELPDWLRTLAFILLGIQTGTAVNADTLYRAAQWPLSIVCMSVTVVIIVWACMLYYERLRKWDSGHGVISPAFRARFPWSYCLRAPQARICAGLPFRKVCGCSS